MTKGVGVCATAMWIVNSSDLCMSARHTFTIALSNNGDSDAEMKQHHRPVFDDLEELKMHGWTHPKAEPDDLRGTHEVHYWRVADGKAGA